jgi:hypothetical protein
VPEISRQTVRVLLLATFVFAVPLFHLGVPFLLAHFGPRCGWNGDYPGPLNFLGALPILAGAILLAWTLTTMLLVAGSLPPRVSARGPAHAACTDRAIRLDAPSDVRG